MTTIVIIKFLRDTLPHGEYRVNNVVMSHEELAGYVLGQLLAEGQVCLFTHHLEKDWEIDIVCFRSERVLKVVKCAILVADTDYGFGDYTYETLGQIDLNPAE